jgi:hypothetical protein
MTMEEFERKQRLKEELQRHSSSSDVASHSHSSETSSPRRRDLQVCAVTPARAHDTGLTAFQRQISQLFARPPLSSKGMSKVAAWYVPSPLSFQAPRAPDSLHVQGQEESEGSDKADAQPCIPSP